MTNRIDYLRARLLKEEREYKKLQCKVETLRRSLEDEMRHGCGGGDMNQKAENRDFRSCWKSAAAAQAVCPC